MMSSRSWVCDVANRYITIVQSVWGRDVVV